MSETLEIGEVLNHIKQSDLEYFNNLTEEQQKKFPCFVVQKWVSFGNDSRLLIDLNAKTNKFLNISGMPKNTIWQSLALIPTQKDTNFRYRRPKKKTKKNSIKLLSLVFGFSTKKAREVIQLFDESDMVSFAEEIGMTDAEIKKIKKEFE